ncbi:MAG: site-2 protease family protein, partial [Phycisphaerae bacterium]
ANAAQHWIMRFYGLSYFLLLINLLPIFPFDGGRIVQAALWPRKGYESSMLIATGTGMVGAICIGLVGIFLQESWLVLMIAIFGYLTCWQTRRLVREGGAFVGGEFGYDFSQGYTSLERNETKERQPGYLERRRARRAAAKAERERLRRALHEREVERILRKISETGIGSLSASERRILERETERQRTTSDSGSDSSEPFGGGSAGG